MNEKNFIITKEIELKIK